MYINRQDCNSKCAAVKVPVFLGRVAGCVGAGFSTSALSGN